MGRVEGFPVPELLALILALSWYFSLLPEQSDLLTMFLIITTFTGGSFIIVFTKKSGFTVAAFICAAAVTVLEMYIILWRKDSSYYPTIVLTALSSGTTVWIIGLRFKGKPSPNVLQEVKADGTKPRLSTDAKIGIFSRSSPEEYIWLINYLKESSSHTVVPFVITNTNNIKFREEVYRCNCAILYHSMRGGRINITDVMDSLYDDELEYLSSELGKQNVAVVVDDLDDGSSTVRNRILQSQPKIENLAWNIFLIDKQTKKNNSIIKKLINPINEMFMAGL
ncbi:uncharacterized protein LOC495470 [Xenopus laevis]|uniref:LOC495470 protein n=1 Tax=Xenopus laevis TaxID=8355 RepID=Q5U4L9_XENLA|nr:uncharacterized protein LOC495470 [Xenopus laevis]AAH85042.1 LOC495470 protein [Xenopus laevis]